MENESIAALDPSDTKLVEDTSANRLGVGTDGRIFFETDSIRVPYDDDSAWQTIPTINIADTDHTAVSFGSIRFVPSIERRSRAAPPERRCSASRRKLIGIRSDEVLLKFILYMMYDNTGRAP